MHLLFAIFLFFAVDSTPNFQVRYKLVYQPDSTNLNNIKEEAFLLSIKENKQSYFCSEGFWKADSIQGLRRTGLLSAAEYMGDPKYRFRTAFDKFIAKSLETRESRIFEKISFDQFEFSVPNHLKWEMGMEEDTIAGYACVKATTSFAGRDYVAWFAPELPIPDGPYLFWGLPGLIVKIGDTRNQYVFTLERFGAYTGVIKEWPEYASRRKVKEASAQKIYEYREEVRKDPFGVIERRLGPSTFNGVPTSDPSIKNSKAWNNNPLELKLIE
ncbi:GLPGLI family protein [Dyadobacter jejuensis]|uniref:GLPGLI family protein n=1 Tax=Dyadobacter jejuensis TaxID=1082580 RepID=A0A316AI65_9BACT|nr:GLPGLI family protein [Dyadobacter jejuensis]PWJ56560.1 GLPGLI family protein [Dyadobacter jejuensis]